MSLVIGHEPAYYSCCATVDLNLSVRQAVEKRFWPKIPPMSEGITTTLAIQILKEVKAESETKLGAIVVICIITPLLFAITMAALNAVSVPVVCAVVVPIAAALIGEKLNVFPFSLIKAYKNQALEAGKHIYKLENKDVYQITNDQVLLDPPEDM